MLEVLQVVARRGAPTLAELDDAMLEHGGPDETLPALDACVDDGLVAVVGRGWDLDAHSFRLTARGRRFLLASSRGAQAA